MRRWSMAVLGVLAGCGPQGVGVHSATATRSQDGFVAVVARLTCVEEDGSVASPCEADGEAFTLEAAWFEPGVPLGRTFGPETAIYRGSGPADQVLSTVEGATLSLRSSERIPTSDPPLRIHLSLFGRAGGGALIIESP